MKNPDYVKQARNRILKIQNNKGKLSQEQLEDIRLELTTLRFLIAEELMPVITSAASYTEMNYDDIHTQEFGKFYKAYSTETEEGSNKLKYTRSSAESFARNTCKLKYKKVKGEDGKVKKVLTETYKAKKKAEDAKNEEKRLYQLMKSIDQQTNALAAITKRQVS